MNVVSSATVRAKRISRVTITIVTPGLAERAITSSKSLVIWASSADVGSYYHCTGPKGKCPSPMPGRRATAGQFATDRLTFDDEVFDWVRAALRTTDAHEKHRHEAAIGRLQSEYRPLEGRNDAMYVDTLDGRIDTAFFNRMAAHGVTGKPAASATSNATRARTGPTWRRAFGFSNSRNRPGGRCAGAAVKKAIRGNPGFGCPSSIRIEPYARRQSDRLSVCLRRSGGSSAPPDVAMPGIKRVIGQPEYP